MLSPMANTNVTTEDAATSTNSSPVGKGTLSDEGSPSPGDYDASEKDDSSTGCITVRTAKLMTDFGYSDAEQYEASDLDSNITYDIGEWTEDDEGEYPEEDAKDQEEEEEEESPACGTSDIKEVHNEESTPNTEDLSPVIPDEFDYNPDAADVSVKRRSASFHHVCRKMDGFRSSKDGKLRSLKSQLNVRLKSDLLKKLDD